MNYDFGYSSFYDNFCLHNSTLNLGSKSLSVLNTKIE